MIVMKLIRSLQVGTVKRAVWTHSVSDTYFLPVRKFTVGFSRKREYKRNTA